MNEIRIVIVDDEFLNRELVKLLIQRFRPEYKICGIASTLREAVKVISDVKPNVVFLDIKMPDGSGFDLLDHFKVKKFEIIFITGFDDYYLRALKHRALDYILKPIDLDDFQKALDKVAAKLLL